MPNLPPMLLLGETVVEQLSIWIKGAFGNAVHDALAKTYIAVVAPVIAEPRLHPALIATTVVAAGLVYLFWNRKRDASTTRGFLRYLLPRGVFLHPSAVLDYKFFIVNQLLMGHLKLGRLVVGAVSLLFVAELVSGLLKDAFGPSPAHAAPSFGATLAFTMVSYLAYDFAKYAAHYLTHKVPVLWEFHKVHHAAETLTPISAFRSHPIDIMFDFFCRLVLGGIVGGVYAYLYPHGIVELTILGFNAFAFVMHYSIGHLQHSHIPLSYGALSRFLVSPVMHQVHHSIETRHWDRNFGFSFALWDWLFGTLYVPSPGESFRLGLPDGGERYRRLRDLYVVPFVGIARRWRARPAATPTT